MGRTGPAGIHGVCWHFSRPPIEEIECEWTCAERDQMFSSNDRVLSAR